MAQADVYPIRGTFLPVPKPSDSKTSGSRLSEERAVTDAELLQRHLSGDQGAFAGLIERYKGELFSFLARFTGDAALAEDIFQEAFLQVHVSAATFDMSRRLKPWLFTIAANKARDAMRSRSRRPAAPLDATVPGSDGQTSYSELIPADIPPPEESMLNLETRLAVETIIREMPENSRVVLVMNYFQGFAYKEIAEILNLPLGTVKSRLHAAVKLFAQRWKTSVESSDDE